MVRPELLATEAANVAQQNATEQDDPAEGMTCSTREEQRMPWLTQKSHPRLRWTRWIAIDPKLEDLVAALEAIGPSQKVEALTLRRSIAKRLLL